MRCHWEFDAADVRRVKAIIAQRATCRFVRERKRRNLDKSKPAVTRDKVWVAMVGAILTSQQPSGPTSAVTRFLCLDPFPLRVDACDDKVDLATYVRKALQGFGGIRFAQNRIPDYLQKNLPWLTGPHWAECLGELEYLRANDGLEHERRAANFFDDRFWGLGPKQSRNMLQMLGLTRYVVPIDSRVGQWMSGLGFHVDTSGLGVRAYYQWLEDGLHALCKACGVYPCILDAAVFGSFDREAWTAETAKMG